MVKASGLRVRMGGEKKKKKKKKHPATAGSGWPQVSCSKDRYLAVLKGKAVVRLRTCPIS